MDEKRFKLGKNDWSEFPRLVRIPNDWSECRTIGPNSERLVRMPNDWSEFRTIGPNAERLTSLTSVFQKPRKKKTVESMNCSAVRREVAP